MKLLVLNPNSTAAMTARVGAELRRIGPPALQLREATAADGPPVIASRETFAAGAASGLRLLQAQPPWADAVLLACFGDPGLQALRTATPIPVAGMAEAAFLEAAAAGRHFHVLTAGAAWDGLLRERATALGLDALLDGITILPATGLDVLRNPQAWVPVIQQALDGLAQRGAPWAILAGAGFAGLTPALRYAGPLTDGIGAGLRWLQALRPSASGHHRPAGSAP